MQFSNDILSFEIIILSFEKKKKIPLCTFACERNSEFLKSDKIGLVNRVNIFFLSFPRAEADSPVYYFCPFLLLLIEI